MNPMWPMVRLNEVLRRSNETLALQSDAEYKEITVRLWGKGVILRGVVTGAEVATQNRCLARAGQLILSRIDARNGALGIVPNELEGAIVTNDFPVFTLNSTRLLPTYFGWICRTAPFVQQCQRASEGTTNRVRLQENKFLALEIPLPPLEEQQRIVARIEELAAQIEGARALRQQALEEMKALFEAAVGHRMSRVDNYPKKQLGTLAVKIGSGSTPLGGRASYPPNGIPFVRSLNVRMRRFQWDDIVFISPETHANMTATHVHPNDVFLNITGASIGRVACAPEDLSEGNVNQHVAIIRPLNCLAPRFLMYWLSQPTVQDVINNRQKGATRQGFTKSQIEAFEIPVPPVTEQERIVVELDVLQAEVEALNNLQTETAAELDALLPSILDRAFKGEL